MRKLEKKKVSGDIERKVVIGAVMSSSVCRELSLFYEKGLIPSKAVNYILETCVQYYSTKGTAPGRLVQALYEVDVARGVLDEDTEDLCNVLLESCSKEFEMEDNFNHDYYADLTRRFLSGRKLLRLSNDLKAQVERDKIEESEEMVSCYQGTTTAGTIKAHNPFTDPDLVREAFSASEEPLLRFRGAYGELVNDILVRDTFLALMGPEKRGKTWQLLEFAAAGLRARRNVAFFSLGDMSEKQLALRMAIRLVGRSNRKKYCGERNEPVVDCAFNQDNSCGKKCRTCSVGLGIEREDILSGDFVPEQAPKKYSPCTACSDVKKTFWYRKIKSTEPLEWREAYQALNKFYSQWMVGRNFKMCCVPNNSLSISGVDKILQGWAKGSDPFIPDVIVTDYMDIAMGEANSFREFRHSENEKWKAGRRLSQDWHALHVSATQADAASYDSNTINENNFSEDKRKYGHVNGGIIGLNQTREEKRLSLMRVNLMFAREEDFQVQKTCTLLQNLSRGRAHIDSFWS